ncbi:hypothetical protein C8F01DRAFT_1147448 [Mycena amicta]|nr:hypothetical protein C8F01DRAFT_1147448 [Mycena amicta]
MAATTIIIVLIVLACIVTAVLIVALVRTRTQRRTAEQNLRWKFAIESYAVKQPVLPLVARDVDGAAESKRNRGSFSWFASEDKLASSPALPQPALVPLRTRRQDSNTSRSPRTGAYAYAM